MSTPGGFDIYVAQRSSDCYWEKPTSMKVEANPSQTEANT